MKKKTKKQRKLSVLYAYVSTENLKYAVAYAKKNKVKGGRSGYVNALLTRARTNSARRATA